VVLGLTQVSGSPDINAVRLPVRQTPATFGQAQRSPVDDPHTQIAAGLEQLVILTRVTFPLRDVGTFVPGAACEAVWND